jgi:hypothetical protein
MIMNYNALQFINIARTGNRQVIVKPYRRLHDDRSTHQHRKVISGLPRSTGEVPQALGQGKGYQPSPQLVLIKYKVRLLTLVGHTQSACHPTFDLEYVEKIPHLD